MRSDFLENVSEICSLMKELKDDLYDDSWLRLAELNKINALLDESLDYVWKMVYGVNREKYEIDSIEKDKHKDIDGYVSMYTNIMNDKLELVSSLGELFDTIMVEVQSVASEIDNTKLSYDILVDYWNKWNDYIIKLVSMFNIYIKPDAKKQKVKPSTKMKK